MNPIYFTKVQFLEKLCHGKTGQEGKMIEDEVYEPSIMDSYGIRLSEKQVDSLLPYCNALDFEPYRDKEMSLDDEGVIGYRDEVDLLFTAISESYLPLLELPMGIYYDEEHIWPSEKLYRYLVKTFFKRKRLRRGPLYGRSSLTCW